MLDCIETLMVLAETGTMQRAANRLHVTQSAVSKRIATLEFQTGQKLTQQVGRRLELTPAAHRLIEQAGPPLGELRSILQYEQSEASGVMRIDVAASVLLGQGAKILSKCRDKLSSIELKVSVHHSSVAIERVMAGASMLALVHSSPELQSDLQFLALYQQPLCIVPSGLKRFALKRGSEIKLMTIEHYTDAWKLISGDLETLSKKSGIKFTPDEQLQSFSSIATLAKHGFGHGLVPIEITETLGLKKRDLIMLPSPGMNLSVGIVGRKTTFASAQFHTLLKSLGHA